MEISIIGIERGHIGILQYDEWNVVCDMWTMMWYAVVYITHLIWNVTDTYKYLSHKHFLSMCSLR